MQQRVRMYVFMVNKTYLYICIHECHTCEHVFYINTVPARVTKHGRRETRWDLQMPIGGKLRNILPWCQRVIFSLGVCGHRWVVSFFLPKLRSVEKRARRFRNVARNFAYLLLVSRTSQENVLLVIQIVVDITLLSSKLCHKNTFCLHYLVNDVLTAVESDKRQISE